MARVRHTPPSRASTVRVRAPGTTARGEQLTSITVHRSDELPHDWRIAHPLLKVHLVNGFTGHPLRKSEPRRPATTRHELAGAARPGARAAPLPTILPMMTKPYRLRGAPTRLPNWEEELLIHEDFSYLLHPRVFLLVELLDFAPEATAEGQMGLRPFAWGFLKTVSGPMSAPAHANLLRPMPLRLQLYKWLKGVRAKEDSGMPDVWAQYLAAGRQTYSSTIYLTIRPQVCAWHARTCTPCMYTRVHPADLQPSSSSRRGCPSPRSSSSSRRRTSTVRAPITRELHAQPC